MLLQVEVPALPHSFRARAYEHNADVCDAVAIERDEHDIENGPPGTELEWREMDHTRRAAFTPSVAFLEVELGAGDGAPEGVRQGGRGVRRA